MPPRRRNAPRRRPKTEEDEGGGDGGHTPAYAHPYAPVEEPEPQLDAESEIMKNQYAGIDSDEDEVYDANDVDMDGIMKKHAKTKKGGIKWLHIFFLVLMMGSAILPAIVFLIDNMGGAVNGLLPSLGAAMAAAGMVATPKKRLIEFYEKHDPEKVDKVEAAIKRYAGDYKTMTKRLEAKYNDYGFFIGWENDSGFAAIQKEGMAVLQEKGAVYYQQYVPFQIRNGFKNIYLNANHYGKKAYKMLDKMVGGKPAPKSKRSKSSKSKSRK